MDLELRGRTVLITGASKGIGLACAHGFAAEGSNLHLVSRTQADLGAAKEAIEAQHGVSVQVHALDLSKPGAAEALATACPQPSVLVNNAGAIPGGDLQQVDEERWREAWDLKVFGYVNLTRLYLARMTERGSGVIVNVMGLAGERPVASYIAGSAGNASLMAFTRALGGASLDHGVRVLGVNPGPVSTARIEWLMRTKAETEFGDPERWKEYMEKLPSGRAAATEQVADLVVFLASARASYISGTVVTIDGGLAHHEG